MTVAGILLIAVPIAFNVTFARLAATFDYPDVLRQDDALTRFKAGGNALVLTWRSRRIGPVLMLCAPEFVGAVGRSRGASCGSRTSPGRCGWLRSASRCWWRRVPA